MADTIDKANDSQEIILNSWVRNQSKEPKLFNPTMKCWYCGEDTGDTMRRFCCFGCAKDWEEENQRNTRTRY